MMPWAKYISVVLASMLKFIAGPVTGLALGLPWYETALCTLIGMMLTVFIISSFGQMAQQIIKKYQKQKPLLFSKRARLAVKIWQKSGITGIALLTPLIFTPIGGTLVAVSFKVPLLKTITQMLLWGTVWAIVITWILYEFRGLF
ncbi:MAG: hypothetical protein R2822_26695 [Spirosomataceae bacterium]